MRLRIPVWGSLTGLALCCVATACDSDLTSDPPVPISMALVMGGTQSGIVGTPLDTALTVQVRSSSGRPLPHVLVRFHGPGTLTPDEVESDALGRAATRWTLPPVAGQYQSFAVVNGLDSVRFSATAAPGAPLVVAVEGDSQAAPAGSALELPLRVSVRDALGNPVPASVVQVTAGRGNGTPGALSLTTDSTGIAALDWRVDSLPGEDTLALTSGSLPARSVIAFGYRRAAPPEVAAGMNFSCRITTSGDAQCWGQNAQGQLGDGTFTARSVPGATTGLAGLASISAGVYHTCARNEGQVSCWGLGGGYSTPFPQFFLSDRSWDQVDVGADFTCAVDVAARIQCAGGNGIALGNGSGLPSNFPGPIAGDQRFLEVSAGNSHACGITVDGVAWCWGNGGGGALGVGTVSTSLVPARVQTPQRFFHISAGIDQTCALTADGRAFCWGRGFNRFDLTPVAVNTTARFKALSAGFAYICGITHDDRGYCWGDNRSGQVGRSSGATDTPGEVDGNLRFSSIATGFFHTCGRTLTGLTYCWGDNISLEIGIGETAQRETPTPVSGGLVFVELGGGESTCGRTAAGQVWCWGPDWGPSPTRISDGRVYRELVSGASCGLTTSDEAWCWSAGQPPVPLGSGTPWASLSGNGVTWCGVSRSGQGYCWGPNRSGEVGDSTRDPRTQPTPPAGNHNFRQFIVTGDGACGVAADSTAWCWGRGPLGDGTPGSRDDPGPVSGGHHFAKITANSRGVDVCGLTAQGDGWCWGLGQNGQLGDGLATDALVPVHIAAGPFTSLALAKLAACGVTVSLETVCWGTNFSGILGRANAPAMSPLPVGVDGNHTFNRVIAWEVHVCALDAAGSAWCWGENRRGQLGIGVQGDQLSPVLIP